ncbi:uncharacterized protein BT62DRAFT_927015 [Guyanagaster necrorhizus]|uniref:Arrestin-like N-terminal domain-containing protein n=1 Tax=Guyanagaster necrorhizus TaxID=856835 RepID=A0A9P7W2A5_9AGAR|nr:uncharacterized protein BT62DRAFT_927015 [Guyanagaster necrorhizus MCA 3950]KAG7451337.1 hypothetical protein BT62DRAFT_927015 [Guyanagaster necrorhizus MCA 3950]
MSNKDKPWATLKVFSSAKSAKSLPTFYEKETINGVVELEVERGDSIQAVNATVTGRVITGAGMDDVCSFLNITIPVWTKNGNSRSPSPASENNKLCGRHTFPFSIVLPRTVSLTVREPKTFRLPETFLERHTPATVQYDLIITISRGKMRSDSHIKTAFGYVPSSRPDAPSVLRQASYSENLPLMGPDVDPEGWRTHDPVVIRGIMFKTRPVQIECTISFSKPLSYTRGSVIPCMMRLEGSDESALDALSAPSSIAVSLRRQVRYSSKGLSSKQKEQFEDVGIAVWWSTAGSTSHRRCLEGEIRLAKDLKASSDVGHFCISYHIVLNPFDVAGFTHLKPEPLVMDSVSIMTMHAKGPRPLAYSPPAYGPISRQMNDTFSVMRQMTLTTTVIG